MPSIYDNGTYASNVTDWHVSDSRYKADKVTELVGGDFARFKHVAEVGCGAGEILRLLSCDYPDITFHGYEVSSQAYELCLQRQRSNLSFTLGDITKMDVHYDCILCLDVVEHVEDYIGFLKKIRSRGEFKVFNIPLDMSVTAIARVTPIEIARRMVGHLHYFSRESALATLEYCGYEIIIERYNHPFERTKLAFTLSSLNAHARLAASRIAPHLTARFLGGSQLLVVAK
ncbi:class I SAM-dependent methyltransferase [Oricola indica]|uniref:class I SAM-dependent methyltransferase n=1 Tax=Oricola indica TaxID=2872591 RepID=UPI001CBB79F1|nr:class I SAM-dependent methyltransferase [Oricola indica]